MPIESARLLSLELPKVTFRTPLHRLARWVKFRFRSWQVRRKGGVLTGPYDDPFWIESFPVAATRRALRSGWSMAPVQNFVSDPGVMPDERGDD